jgi:hypothetical protein
MLMPRFISNEQLIKGLTNASVRIAVQVVKVSAERGFVEMQWRYALSLSQGDGVPMNKSLGADSVTLAADDEEDIGELGNVVKQTNFPDSTHFRGRKSPLAGGLICDHMSHHSHSLRDNIASEINVLLFDSSPFRLAEEASFTKMAGTITRD